ncbi:unnamed protein product [Adineta ricciae]|uniref:Ig-like domain-containing protein n=1 Tax=Adineta ricciae TaxID=249248 RepID=A0A815A262_ADIRI|nr:unnamed protein product [Adineta ricciae]
MSLDYEPRFTEPLQASYIVREGQPVKLSCRFTAYPKGTITWLKDGTPIDFEALGISRDFTVVKEVDYTALLIKEAFPEDTGSYVVVIRNSIGEAHSFTQLTVEDFFCRTPESELSDTPSKPVFVQSLRDTTINEGQKLKLNAAVNAHPEPEIIWYRNDIPLKNSRDLMLTFDGQLCTLTKERCEKENDTGVYRITAVNSMGQAECTCQVIVQSSDTLMLRDRLQFNHTQPIGGQAVQESEKLLSDSLVEQQSVPTSTLITETKSVSNIYEQQVQTANTTDTLEVPKISRSRSSFHQAKTMKFGSAPKLSFTMNTLPTMPAPEPMLTTPAGFPPEFRQLFHDQKTSLGSTVKFEARAIGTQPLNAYWLFNGSPITHLGSNQHYQQQIFNDTYILTIFNIRYDDIGKYTLHVENAWGKATCTAELFVPPTVARYGKKISRQTWNQL